VTLTELVELPAGSFLMGSTDFYPEETPVRRVSVGGEAIDRHPVTNAQFAEFVAATSMTSARPRHRDGQSRALNPR
jgi:sulfatase modifying factor 1